MAELIHHQLVENCKIAMPDGLRELMADISREVLRNQPENLYKFIADYLSALLVTRENLMVACRICGDVCENICHPGLTEELKQAGLDDKTAVDAAEIIIAYFANSGYKQSDLMLKLVKDTDIEVEHLEAIKDAIHNTFLRQKLKNILIDDSNNEDNDILRAVVHTMRLYDQTKPTKEMSFAMARKIQAAYKGYKVRRLRKTTPSIFKKPNTCIKFAFADAASDSSESVYTINGSANKLSDVDEIAEIAEIEHATLDYTHSYTEFLEKTKIFDKRSGDSISMQVEVQENNNIDYNKDEHDSIHNNTGCFDNFKSEIVIHRQEITEYHVEKTGGDSDKTGYAKYKDYVNKNKAESSDKHILHRDDSLFSKEDSVEIADHIDFSDEIGSAKNDTVNIEDNENTSEITEKDTVDADFDEVKASEEEILDLFENNTKVLEVIAEFVESDSDIIKVAIIKDKINDEGKIKSHDSGNINNEDDNPACDQNDCPRRTSGQERNASDNYEKQSGKVNKSNEVGKNSAPNLTQDYQSNDSDSNISHLGSDSQARILSIMQENFNRD